MSRGCRAEHFLGEKVDDEPVVASELADEGTWRRVTAQGKRREIQSGWPPFSALKEIGQLGLGKLKAGDIPHQRRPLCGLQPQFGHPDLDHLTGRAQPRQRERRTGPRDERELGRWRQMKQQESGLFVAAQAP